MGKIFQYLEAIRLKFLEIKYKEFSFQINMQIISFIVLEVSSVRALYESCLIFKCSPLTPPPPWQERGELTFISTSQLEPLVTACYPWPHAASGREILAHSCVNGQILHNVSHRLCLYWFCFSPSDNRIQLAPIDSASKLFDKWAKEKRNEWKRIGEFLSSIKSLPKIMPM